MLSSPRVRLSCALMLVLVYVQECHSVLYEEGKEKVFFCSRKSVPAIGFNILRLCCVDVDKLTEDVGEHKKK